MNIASSLLRGGSHLKWSTLYNRCNQRGPAIVIGRRFALNTADGRGIVVFQTTTQHIRQKLFGHGLRKLCLLREQCLLQSSRSIDLCTVEKHSRCVDWISRIGRSPLPDSVKILQAE